MQKKEEIYQLIRNLGVLTYIPVILAVGPFLGYMVGDYLEKKMTLPGYLSLILAALGFVASVMEMIRILKFVDRTSKKG